MTTRAYSEEELQQIKETLQNEERTEDDVQVPLCNQNLFELCSGMAFFTSFIEQLLPGPEKELAIEVYQVSCSFFNRQL